MVKYFSLEQPDWFRKLTVKKQIYQPLPSRRHSTQIEQQHEELELLLHPDQQQTQPPIQQLPPAPELPPHSYPTRSTCSSLSSSSRHSTPPPQDSGPQGALQTHLIPFLTIHPSNHSVGSLAPVDPCLQTSCLLLFAHRALTEGETADRLRAQTSSPGQARRRELVVLEQNAEDARFEFRKEWKALLSPGVREMAREYLMDERERWREGEVEELLRL
jgi:hypothetical protein